MHFQLTHVEYHINELFLIQNSNDNSIARRVYSIMYDEVTSQKANRREIFVLHGDLTGNGPLMEIKVQ
jgi:hypothetical protein